MTLLNNTVQLPVAIGDALKGAFPRLRVDNRQTLTDAENQARVLISVESNGPGERSLVGRKAQALSVSLRATVASVSSASDACHLASQLMDLALDNRWGFAPHQCDLPASIVAAPSPVSGAETDDISWTVSFTQTLYLGPGVDIAYFSG